MMSSCMLIATSIALPMLLINKIINDSIKQDRAKYQEDLDIQISQSMYPISGYPWDHPLFITLGRDIQKDLANDFLERNPLSYRNYCEYLEKVNS